jgi:hypothetical protein
MMRVPRSMRDLCRTKLSGRIVSATILVTDGRAILLISMTGCGTPLV